MTALGRRVVVVGGGIVGLAVAERVVRDEPILPGHGAGEGA